MESLSPPGWARLNIVVLLSALFLLNNTHSKHLLVMVRDDSNSPANRNIN
jgi:hypothetical protein